MRIKILLAVCSVAATIAAPTAAEAAPPKPHPDHRAGDVAVRVERHAAFGGIRVTPDRSTIEVFVTHHDPALVRAAGAAAAGAPLKITMVEHSWAKLARLRDRIVADDAALVRQGVNVVKFGVSDTLNRVTLTVEDLTPAKRALLERRYGARLVAVVDGGPAAPVYSREDDSPPWNGGIVISFDATEGDCSTGAAVKNSAGREFLLTAGHCFTSGGKVYDRRVYQESDSRTTDDPTYMGLADAEYPMANTSGYDLALIDVGSSASGLIFRSKSPTTDASGVPQKGTIRAVVGTGLCTSGAFTGEKCASYVTEFDMTLKYGNGAMVIHVNELTRESASSTTPIAGPGDSGGPVYAVRTDGLYVAGTILAIPSNMMQGYLYCANNDWVYRGYKCSNVVYFAGIGSTLSHLGVSLVTL